MLSSFQGVLNNTCCVISALYMISMSGARTSPLRYLYFCMRTKLCSFFLLWWTVEIGRASYTTDIYSLWSNWKFFFLCLNSLLKYLYYDTAWLCHNMSCVYLRAPSEGTIILILQRGTESTVLQQTVRQPVSSQNLHGHHTNFSKYKVKNNTEWHC